MSNFRRVIATITLIGLTISFFALLSGTKEKFSNHSLKPNEVLVFQEKSIPLSKTLTTAQVFFPSISNASHLMEVTSGKSKLQVFVIDSKLIIFPSYLAGTSQTSIGNSIELPIDTKSDQNYFQMICDSTSKEIVFKSGKSSQAWLSPNKFNCSNAITIRSGNIPELDLIILHQNKFELNSNLGLVVALLIFICVGCFSSKLRSKFMNKIARQTNKFLKSPTRLATTLLALGIGLLALLPSSTPTGNLITTEVNLKNISKSDLVNYNKESSGAWLFSSSPNLGYKPEDFATTINFAFDLGVHSHQSFEQLFVYGIPSDSTYKPFGNSSFVVSLSQNQQIVFQVQGKHASSKWTSQRLLEGVHHVEGRIIKGQEIELTVDNVLTSAMSVNAPIYLQTQPNLFIGDYLRENLISGSLTWNISTSLESQIAYAANRLLGVLTFLALSLGMFLLILVALPRRKIFDLAGNSSNRTLIRMVSTFAILNIVGLIVWCLGLQFSSSLVPRNTSMFLADVRFSDFTQLFVSAQNHDPYTVALITYPPFGMYLWDLLGFLSTHQATICIIAVALALIGAIFWEALSSRNDIDILKRISIFLTVLLSFPILFAIDRGNLDLLVIALLLLATFLQRHSFDNKVVGLIIGLAAAIKIYPLLLLPAFAHRRKDWSIMISSLISVLFFTEIGAIRYDLSRYELIKKVVLASSGAQLTGDTATRWNGSLASLITTLTRGIYPQHEHAVWQVFSSSVAVLIFLLIGIAGLLVLIFKRANRAMIFLYWCTAVLLVFPSSPAYRFTIMLVGILSIIMYGIPQISRPKLLGVLIGVIISPVVFWYFGTGFTNTFSIIIPIATLMLALLLVYESILSSEERPLHHSLANHSLLKRLNSLSRVSNLD